MNERSAARPVQWRALTFAALVLALVGWPVYSLVNEWWTGGVHDHGSYIEADLKAMGFFQFSPGEPSIKDVPARFRALDGKKVLLEGIVQPALQAGNEVTDFSMVFSEVSCCIGYGRPQVQERVFVNGAGGKRLVYDSCKRQHRVMGTLHVNVKTDPDTGEVVEVYRLDGDWVKAVD